MAPSLDAIDFVAIAIAQTRLAQPSRTTSTLYKAECIIPSSTCPPSSRVSSFCLRQSPTGRALDAIDFVAIAIPSLRSLRLSHIKRRRLIMPLVALVQKNHSAPATSYFHLVLGTRFGRRRCSSSSESECFYKNPPNKQSAYFFPPQLRTK